MGQGAMRSRWLARSPGRVRSKKCMPPLRYVLPPLTKNPGYVAVVYTDSFINIS